MLNEKLFEAITQEPLLPNYIHELQIYWLDEQARRANFHARLPMDEKIEYINGELIAAMPVRKIHNDVLRLLLKLLDEFVHLHHLGYVGFENLLMSLTRNDYEPDVCFWGNEKASVFTEAQTIFPPADFVVEILSESTEVRDRTVKFVDYAANGIREYWMIDPDMRTVEQYVLEKEKNSYELFSKLRDGLIHSQAVKGFTIPVAALFDDELNRIALREFGNSAM